MCSESSRFWHFWGEGGVTAHSCLNENATVEVGHLFPSPGVCLKEAKW